MAWRYQPVIQVSGVGDAADECFSLVEVHLHEDGTLKSWAEDLAIAPVGNDLEDLIGEMSHMWMSAMCWKPVFAHQLRTGMSFERTVDREVRDKLADFIEGGGAFLRSHTKAGA